MIGQKLDVLLDKIKLVSEIYQDLRIELFRYRLGIYGNFQNRVSTREKIIDLVRLSEQASSGISQIAKEVRNELTKDTKEIVRVMYEQNMPIPIAVCVGFDPTDAVDLPNEKMYCDGAGRTAMITRLREIALGDDYDLPVFNSADTINEWAKEKGFIK